MCEHLRMAVVEPGTPQEMKDWIDLSFKLSRAAELYIGYIVTTVQADGGGTVICKPNQFPTLNSKHRVALDTARVNFDKVLLPPRTWQHEEKIPGRFLKTIEAARELGLNRIIPATNKPAPMMRDGTTRVPCPTLAMGMSASPREDMPTQAWDMAPGPPLFSGSREPQRLSPLGFIVTGMGGPYLEHVLADLGLRGRFPVLQMGMSYPVDVQLVAEFSKLCKNMIVIEERRSFLEKNIRDGLYHTLDADQATDISAPPFRQEFPAQSPRHPRNSRPESFGAGADPDPADQGNRQKSPPKCAMAGSAPS